MLCLCTESFSASYNDIILSELTVLLTEATITFLAQMVINNTFESTEADLFPTKEKPLTLFKKKPIDMDRDKSHQSKELLRIINNLYDEKTRHEALKGIVRSLL